MGKTEDGEKKKLTKEEKEVRCDPSLNRPRNSDSAVPPPHTILIVHPTHLTAHPASQAKKLKKEKKRLKEEAAAAEGEKPAKKAKVDDDDKAAKKAAKKAKKEAEAAAAEAPAPAAEAPAAAEGGEENTRVYVGNLPWAMTEDWMKEIMASAGGVTNVEWLTHADSGKFKGSGFLTFESSAAAAAAVLKNGEDCEGRPMKIELATPRKPKVFGGRDASDPGEPSDGVFVGNLPWDFDEGEFKALFAECGEVQRIKYLMKEEQFTGNCFLDFNTVDEATKAVALNGTEFKGRPLRLNFSKGKKKDDSWGGGGDKPKWGGAAAGGRTERPYKPQGAKPDGCTELFCGNLPWSVTDESIADFFKSAGTVTNTRWLNDKESGDFKGVGFISFGTTEEVDAAVQLGGEQLDGRPIRIDYAGSKPKPKQGAWQGGW